MPTSSQPTPILAIIPNFCLPHAQSSGNVALDHERAVQYSRWPRRLLVDLEQPLYDKISWAFGQGEVRLLGKVIVLDKMQPDKIHLRQLLRHTHPLIIIVFDWAAHAIIQRAYKGWVLSYPVKGGFKERLAFRKLLEETLECAEWQQKEFEKISTCKKSKCRR